jgi:hypothetical protein
MSDRPLGDHHALAFKSGVNVTDQLHALLAGTRQEPNTNGEQSWSDGAAVLDFNRSDDWVLVSLADVHQELAAFVHRLLCANLQTAQADIRHHRWHRVIVLRREHQGIFHRVEPGMATLIVLKIVVCSHL